MMASLPGLSGCPPSLDPPVCLGIEESVGPTDAKLCVGNRPSAVILEIRYKNVDISGLEMTLKRSESRYFLRPSEGLRPYHSSASATGL